MADEGNDDPGERLADDLRTAERLLVVVAALVATITAAGLPDDAGGAGHGVKGAFLVCGFVAA